MAPRRLDARAGRERLGGAARPPGRGRARHTRRPDRPGRARSRARLRTALARSRYASKPTLLRRGRPGIVVSVRPVLWGRLDEPGHNPTVLADLAVADEPEFLVGGERAVEQKAGGNRVRVFGVSLDPPAAQSRD